MRLLNVRSGDLHQFSSDEQVPRYAIISHTWGAEEISLRDWETLDRAALKSRQGYFKIKRARIQAIDDGLEWVWVDTCCIDRTSPAEIEEAINSMFRWYGRSSVCYAYLEDIAQPVLGASLSDALRVSRWFTRGWTLQELIAPPEVVFYSTGWEVLGTKTGLAAVLESLTGVDADVLLGATDPAGGSVSASRRMSWAAGRRTSRPEDVAYCLLGLFGTPMSLLYGEGRERAFRRLQEAVLRENPTDHTLLAWGDAVVGRRSDLAPPPEALVVHDVEALAWSDADAGRPLLGLLADSPDRFRNSADLVPMTAAAEMYYFDDEDDGGRGEEGGGGGCRNAELPVTFAGGGGLRVELPMLDGPEPVLYTWRSHKITQARRGRLAVLFCHRRGDPYEQFAVPLTCSGPASYGRTRELVVGNFNRCIWPAAAGGPRLSARVLVRPDQPRDGGPGPALGHGDVVVRRWAVGNSEDLLMGEFRDERHNRRLSAREGVLRMGGGGDDTAGALLWSISALTESETLCVFVKRQRPRPRPEDDQRDPTAAAAAALGATTVDIWPLSRQIDRETVDEGGTTWFPHGETEAEVLALAAREPPLSRVFKSPSDTWIAPAVGSILTMVLARVDRIPLAGGRGGWADVVDMVGPYSTSPPLDGTPRTGEGFAAGEDGGGAGGAGERRGTYGNF
ncbi:hypothetical protein RB594_009537 [Gaeumannomyces avenae]